MSELLTTQMKFDEIMKDVKGNFRGEDEPEGHPLLGGVYDKIVQATSSLREFLETRGAKVMDTIRAEKAISDESEAALKSSLAEWVAGFSA